jgi:hypothetical protein
MRKDRAGKARSNEKAEKRADYSSPEICCQSWLSVQIR